MKLQITHHLKKLLIALSIGFIGLGSGSALAESAHDTRNVVGLFLGTSITEAEDPEFTFGFEYEYHFSKYIGAGPIVEHTDNAHHEDGITVALGAVHLHPVGGLRLTAAAGREFVHGDHAHGTFLWRLGTAYDFHFDSFSIAPTANVDFVGDTRTFVLGTVFSYHF